MACSIQQEKEGCIVQDIAFSDIPGQSQLFIKYQEDPDSLREFYPNAALTVSGLTVNIKEVIDNYQTDREVLCSVLESQNQLYGAGSEVFNNIELLRKQNTVAIVTGQQAGTFTGPLYTIYKALTAIKTAEQLRQTGVDAVPVFWIATEDHDFEEVSTATFLNKEGEAFTLKNEAADRSDEIPVGNVLLDKQIGQMIKDIFGSMESTQFSAELKKMLESGWEIGDSYGTSFGKMMTSLLGKYGLILLDPLDKKLKELAAPIYVKAIEKRHEILSALKERVLQLQLKGFHSQVNVDDDHFPMFWHDDNGRRISLRLNGSDRITTKDGSERFTFEELTNIALQSPERLSPAVLLRGVVQDHLLPTLCYFGGGAEVAYFAQSAEVYRVLSRPVTAVMHRQSFSVVEAKHLRTMKKYELEFADITRGIEKQIPYLSEKFIAPEIPLSIAEAEERINTELNRLDRQFTKIDVTLAENLATRRRKILYHIAAIREKFHYSAFRQDADLRRRVEALYNALMPKEHLQERELNVSYFFNRFGNAFIDIIHDNTDPDNRCHRVIYLK